MKKIVHTLLSVVLVAQVGFLPQLSQAFEAQKKKKIQAEQVVQDLKRLEGLMMNEGYWNGLAREMKKDGIQMGNERGEEESYLRIVREGNSKRKTFSVLFSNGLWIKNTFSIESDSLKMISLIQDKNLPNEVLGRNSFILKSGMTKESISKRISIYEKDLERNVKKQWKKRYVKSSSGISSMISSLLFGVKTAHAGPDFKKIFGWIGVVIGGGLILFGTYLAGMLGYTYIASMMTKKPVGGAEASIAVFLIGFLSLASIAFGAPFYSAGRKAVGSPKYLPNLDWMNWISWFMFL